MWVPMWGASRVDVGADVGALCIFSVGASGALLGIAMEEKASNKSFNGMVGGHPALLRANHKFSQRPEFNNSEAHKHDASQGPLFRTKGATQGIPGVAGSPVLGGPRNDLPQPDGLGSQSFVTPPTPPTGARRSGARNEAGLLVNVTTGNVRKTRTTKPLAEGAPPKPKLTRAKSTVPGLTVAGAPRQVRTKRSLSEGDTEATQKKTPGVNKDGTKRQRGSGGARVKGKSVPVTQGSETGGHGGDSEGAWQPAPLLPGSFRVASHGGSKHACPFVQVVMELVMTTMEEVS